jgi:acyl transferase domain-containing protein
MSGTNVFALLCEHAAPRVRPAPPVSDPAQRLVVLSAKTAYSLKAQARKFGEYLRTTLDSPADISFHTCLRRSHYPFRTSAAGGSKHEIAKQFSEFGVSDRPLHPAGAPTTTTVMLFTGQGSQWLGMGKVLSDFEGSQIYVERCSLFLEPILGLSIAQLMNSDAERLQKTKFAQPALFVFEYALARLWMAMGIVPAAVMGHSLGEIVAACIAGSNNARVLVPPCLLCGRLHVA